MLYLLRTTVIILMLLISLLLDAISLIYLINPVLLTEEYHWFVFLSLHGISSLFFALPLSYFFINKIHVNLYLLSLGLTFSMPILGMLLTCIMVFIHRFVRPIKKELKPWIYGDPYDSIDFSIYKIQDLQREKQNTILQKLNNGTSKQRREAVLSLSTLRGPMVINLLNKAVRDSDEYVRSYAQTILQNYFNETEEHLKQMKKALDNSADDIMRTLGIVDLELHMIELNLISNEQVNPIVNRIEKRLHRFLKKNPEHPEALYRLMNCYLLVNKPKLAAECLNHLEDIQYVTNKLFYKKLHILFRQHKWESFIAHILKAVKKTPSLKTDPNLRFWLKNINNNANIELTKI